MGAATTVTEQLAEAELVPETTLTVADRIPGVSKVTVQLWVFPMQALAHEYVYVSAPPPAVAVNVTD